jgi:hypothetical protein
LIRWKKQRPKYQICSTGRMLRNLTRNKFWVRPS